MAIYGEGAVYDEYGATIEENLRLYIEQNIPNVGPGYPLQVPQDAPVPAFAYQINNKRQAVSHGGPMDYFMAQGQVSIVNPDYEAGKLAEAAMLAVSGYKGMMGTNEIFYLFVSNADAWSEMRQDTVAVLSLVIHYR